MPQYMTGKQNLSHNNPTAASTSTDLIPSFGTKLSMISDEGKGRSMSRSGHTEAQMIGALEQLEARRKAEDVAREVGVSEAHDLRSRLSGTRGNGSTDRRAYSDLESPADIPTEAGSQAVTSWKSSGSL